MAYAVIYPFITEYITSLGTPLDVIGLYAGMAEAGLMITQAAMAPVWAWLADRYGRKRCVMYGFTGTVMSASMTGFGRSVWWIIFWRAMCELGESERPVIGKHVPPRTPCLCPL
ncbi:hypothetical protein I317_07036 [Kwoniella heveanensis CBS 569]|nr:hypothetical protein I317_07036 [Kwoniella heveanensis CBS 569]